MRITQDEFDIISKASEITLEDYEIKWTDHDNLEGYIDSEDLLVIIQDLICEIEHKEEEIEDIKQDIESNYKPLTIAEQVE
jgi:hypothetical protein